MLRFTTLLVALLLVSTSPALAEPGDVVPTVIERAAPAPSYQPGHIPLADVALANPPLPDPAVFPIQLMIDDDIPDGTFGIFGPSARQFLWLNRFPNPGPFTLEEVWVLFPAGTDVPLGGDVQIVIYQDPDSDTVNGATLLATVDGTVQSVDGNTFSIFPVAPAIPITNPGDVLVGAINRYYQTGMDPPPTVPAVLDETMSQDRSFIALWSGDPPNPPDLSTAILIDALDSVPAGNLMIRAFGNAIPAPAIAAVPTLGEVALVILAVVLGLMGVVAVRRF